MTLCANCGAANAPDAGHCRNCGQRLETPAIPAVAPPVATPAPHTSQLAVASLVLGIFSLSPLYAVPAVVFGHAARFQIRKSAGRLQGAGMARIGLGLGYAGLAFFAAVYLLFIVLIPQAVEAYRIRRMANGPPAVLAYAITDAEWVYHRRYPKRGFSTTLAQLGPPASLAGRGPEAAGLIPADLASGEASGYRFTYVPGPTDEHGRTYGFSVQAGPLTPEPGAWHFFANQHRSVRAERSKPAGPDSPRYEPLGDASDLRAINAAEVTYAYTYPKIGYSPTLEALGSGGTDCREPNEQHACLIDDALAASRKNGYLYHYAPARRVGGMLFAYAIQVDLEPARVPEPNWLLRLFNHKPPDEVSVEAFRLRFFSDQSGVIRGQLCSVVPGEPCPPATVDSPPLDWKYGGLRGAPPEALVLAIREAEAAYRNRYPKRGYSATLVQLGPPPSNALPSPEAAGLVPPDLASGQASGYGFTYVPGAADKSGRITTYTLHADPEKAQPYPYYFFIDEQGVIHREGDRPAGPDSSRYNLPSGVNAPWSIQR